MGVNPGCKSGKMNIAKVKIWKFGRHIHVQKFSKTPPAKIFPSQVASGLDGPLLRFCFVFSLLLLLLLLRWLLLNRAVDSLTVPGGQEFHFPHFFLKFRSIFPQTWLIFFLILALRVSKSPTQEGPPPGYTTAPQHSKWNQPKRVWVRSIVLSLRLYFLNLLVENEDVLVFWSCCCL